MRLGKGNPPQSPVGLGIALFQFALQMLPFVKQLLVGCCDFPAGLRGGNFPAVEFVAAPGGFNVNSPEITRNCRHGIGLGAEPGQLRMLPVPPGLVLQNFLREQRFAPQRHQPFGVEIAGMNRPQAHWCRQCWKSEIWRGVPAVTDQKN